MSDVRPSEVTPFQVTLPETARPESTRRGVTRRTVLIGAAAAAPLTACSKPTELAGPPPPTPGQALTPVADVPVGSGTITAGTLITQPTPGVFKGFVARCTHAGCALKTVKGDAAICPCHGSSFGLDGEVLRGPAMAPLTPRAVAVKGTEIVAG
ncbi:MAG: Rieske (2Fe-2S) protein [Mycobacterium sp.]|nr:Rieske (2Fe-2S) protein [Mycobacterium sp.]